MSRAQKFADVAMLVKVARALGGATGEVAELDMWIECVIYLHQSLVPRPGSS
jgi:hypothetical protein